MVVLGGGAVSYERGTPVTRAEKGCSDSRRVGQGAIERDRQFRGLCKGTFLGQICIYNQPIF